VEQLRQDLYLDVAKALTGCQLLEQELKAYLSAWRALEHDSSAAALPTSSPEFDEKPLGQLVITFRKANSNIRLIDELWRFKDERNFLAHRAIQECLDLEGELFLTSVHETIPRIREIEATARRLRSDVYNEMNTLLVSRWFEDLTKRDAPADGAGGVT